MPPSEGAEAQGGSGGAKTRRMPLVPGGHREGSLLVGGGLGGWGRLSKGHKSPGGVCLVFRRWGGGVSRHHALVRLMAPLHTIHGSHFESSQ